MTISAISAAWAGNHSAFPTPSSTLTPSAAVNESTTEYRQPATIDTRQPAVSARRAPKRSLSEPATGVRSTIVKLIAPTANPARSSGM